MRYIRRVTPRGKIATFKHISRLQGLCAAEFTIDECLTNLKAQYTKKNSSLNVNALGRVFAFESPTKLLLKNGTYNANNHNNIEDSINLKSITE
eukprot:497123_1